MMFLPNACDKVFDRCVFMTIISFIWVLYSHIGYIISIFLWKVINVLCISIYNKVICDKWNNVICLSYREISISCYTSAYSWLSNLSMPIMKYRHAFQIMMTIMSWLTRGDRYHTDFRFIMIIIHYACL